MGVRSEYDYENTYYSNAAWYTPTHVPLSSTAILPPKSYTDRISRLILTLNTISSLRSHLLHPFQPRDRETLSPLFPRRENTLKVLNQLLHWETLGTDGTIVNTNGPIVEIKKALGWVYIQSGPQEMEKLKEVEQLLRRCELLVERVWRACGYKGGVVGEGDPVTGWTGWEGTHWSLHHEGKEEYVEWDGLFGEFVELAKVMRAMVLREEALGELVGFR